MRGIPKLSFAALAGVLCCSGATTPTTQTGDSHVPTSASGPASGRPAGAPRGHVSEEEALKPRPDLPPDKRAFIVVGPADRPEERRSTRRPPRPRATRCVDLSDHWTPLIFAEETDASGQPLPNRYRRVFLGLANDQLDSDGVPLEPGEQELPRAVRHLPLALGVARALPRDARAPVPRPGERGRAVGGRDRLLRARPQARARTSSKLARVRAELEDARRKRGRSQTLAELAEPQPALVPKVELVEKRAAEKLAMAAVERRLRCEGLLTASSQAQGRACTTRRCASPCGSSSTRT